MLRGRQCLRFRVNAMLGMRPQEVVHGSIPSKYRKVPGKAPIGAAIDSYGFL